MATAGGLGLSNLAGSIGSYGGGAMTSAFTHSNAGASTNGNGYAQVQTSGYAGGSAAGFGMRTHRTAHGLPARLCPPRLCLLLFA